MILPAPSEIRLVLSAKVSITHALMFATTG
jgi:hypothetical protein